MITAGFVILAIGALLFIAAIIIHGVSMVTMFKGNDMPSSKIVVGPVLGGVSYIILIVGLVVLIIGVVLQFL